MRTWSQREWIPFFFYCIRTRKHIDQYILITMDFWGIAMFLSMSMLFLHDGLHFHFSLLQFFTRFEFPQDEKCFISKNISSLSSAISYPEHFGVSEDRLYLLEVEGHLLSQYYWSLIDTVYGGRVSVKDLCSIFWWNNTFRVVCANSSWRLISYDTALHNVSKYQNSVYIVSKISKVVVKSSSLRTDRNDETSVRWSQFGNIDFQTDIRFLIIFHILSKIYYWSMLTLSMTWMSVIPVIFVRET